MFHHLAIGTFVTSRQDTNPSRPNGPQNFELTLDEDHKSGRLRGTGNLYLPIHYTTFSDHVQRSPIYVRGTELCFSEWRRSYRDPKIRNAILESPYVPREERDRVIERGRAFEEDLRVLKLEWGRRGFSPNGIGGPRQVFNVYFQYNSLRRDDLNATLYFADELQMILIALEDRPNDNTDLIRIPYAHIKSVERCHDIRSAVIFHLHSSVVFERYPGGKGALPRPPRLQSLDEGTTYRDGERLTGLDVSHARVLPYCYRTLRAILHESHGELLEKMLETAHIPIFGDWELHLDGQFKHHDHALQGLRNLPFTVAFQIESMLLRGLLDDHQLPIIIKVVVEILEEHNPSKVAHIMSLVTQEPHLLSRDSALPDNDIRTAFKDSLIRRLKGLSALPTATKLGWFNCHRVTITPTSKRLQGPFIDQGNRIIRR